MIIAVIGILFFAVAIAVLLWSQMKHNLATGTHINKEVSSKYPALVSCISCLVLGILHYILWCFPFVAGTKHESDYDYMFHSYESYSYDGYESMNLWRFENSAIATSIIQILTLLCSIAMIIIACLGILKYFGLISALSNRKAKCISRALLITYMVLNVGALIVVFSSFYYFRGYRYSNGVTPGPIIIVLLSIIATVVAFVAPKRKNEGEFEGESELRQAVVCTDCGKNLKFSSSFCSFCGGMAKVVIQAPEPRTYFACSQCGKKSRAGINFCSSCGGKIEEKVIVPPPRIVYECSSCGESAKSTQKFCTSCGGAIIRKEIPYGESE